MSPKTRKRRRYTANFKAEAIRVSQQRADRTEAEVAESLGVTDNLLRTWKRQRDPDRVGDRGETTEVIVARLRRENAVLRRDRDALAKSIAVYVRDRK